MSVKKKQKGAGRPKNYFCLDRQDRKDLKMVLRQSVTIPAAIKNHYQCKVDDPDGVVAAFYRLFDKFIIRLLGDVK